MAIVVYLVIFFGVPAFGTYVAVILSEWLDKKGNINMEHNFKAGDKVYWISASNDEKHYETVHHIESNRVYYLNPENNNIGGWNYAENNFPVEDLSPGDEVQWVKSGNPAGIVLATYGDDAWVLGEGSKHPSTYDLRKLEKKTIPPYNPSVGDIVGNGYKILAIDGEMVWVTLTEFKDDYKTIPRNRIIELHLKGPNK
ncbi:MAG: hypothetical protein P4L79_09930 [Legionella sp.]|uniref:hypothetical protein n=1 Tax=Legionella sp. TaxID=459 RepID=UPI00284D1AEA|nr:hypothetical protein [Legionella sp.]